jgi:prolipoprotein diacylglyceryl transferase
MTCLPVILNHKNHQIMPYLYITWDVDPEIVNFAGVSLRYYGLLFIGGIILAGYVLKRMLPGTRLTVAGLERFSLFAVAGVFAGARLGHCLFYEPSYYLHHPLEMLLPIARDMHGAYHFTGYRGLASHGGVIGMMAALLLYARTAGQNFMYTLDMVAVVAPLTGCFIRLANLMNSEIIGCPASVPWAFVFVREDMLPRHPAQLYEAIACLLIWVFNQFYLYRRHRDMTGTGFFTGWTLLTVFTARFLIEFVKERQVAFEDGMMLDMGQWLSIPFVLTGVVLVMRAVWKEKRMFGHLLGR